VIICRTDSMCRRYLRWSFYNTKSTKCALIECSVLPVFPEAFSP